MAFSFRNLFNKKDGPEPAYPGGPLAVSESATSPFASAFPAGGMQGEAAGASFGAAAAVQPGQKASIPGPGSAGSGNLTVGELAHLLPGSMIRPGGLPTDIVVQLDPADAAAARDAGSGSIKASMFYRACPALFSQPVTDANDLDVAIPPSKLKNLLVSGTSEQNSDAAPAASPSSFAEAESAPARELPASPFGSAAPPGVETSASRTEAAAPASPFGTVPAEAVAPPESPGAALPPDAESISTPGSQEPAAGFSQAPGSPFAPSPEAVPPQDQQSSAPAPTDLSASPFASASAEPSPFAAAPGEPDESPSPAGQQPPSQEAAGDAGPPPEAEGSSEAVNQGMGDRDPAPATAFTPFGRSMTPGEAAPLTDDRTGQPIGSKLPPRRDQFPKSLISHDRGGMDGEDESTSPFAPAQLENASSPFTPTDEQPSQLPASDADPNRAPEHASPFAPAEGGEEAAAPASPFAPAEGGEVAAAPASPFAPAEGEEAAAPASPFAPAEGGEVAAAPASPFAPAEGGEEAAAPASPFAPAEGGEEAAAPASPFAPAEGGEEPAAPASPFAPAEGGEVAAAPASPFAPAEGGEEPAAPASPFAPAEGGEVAAAPASPFAPAEGEEVAAAPASPFAPAEGEEAAAPASPFAPAEGGEEAAAEPASPFAPAEGEEVAAEPASPFAPAEGEEVAAAEPASPFAPAEGEEVAAAPASPFAPASSEDLSSPFDPAGGSPAAPGSPFSSAVVASGAPAEEGSGATDSPSELASSFGADQGAESPFAPGTDAGESGHGPQSDSPFASAEAAEAGETSAAANSPFAPPPGVEASAVAEAAPSVEPAVTADESAASSSFPFGEMAEAEQPADGQAEPVITLSLLKVLGVIPSDAIGADCSSIPEEATTTLSLGSIQPQLASGRVVVNLREIVDGCDDDQQRAALAQANLDLEVDLPLQEVFHNLPQESMVESDAAAQPEEGPALQTPFSNFAGEESGASDPLPAPEAAVTSPFEGMGDPDPGAATNDEVMAAAANDEISSSVFDREGGDEIDSVQDPAETEAEAAAAAPASPFGSETGGMRATGNAEEEEEPADGGSANQFGPFAADPGDAENSEDADDGAAEASFGAASPRATPGEAGEQAEAEAEAEDFSTDTTPADAAPAAATEHASGDGAPVGDGSGSEPDAGTSQDTEFGQADSPALEESDAAAGTLPASPFSAILGDDLEVAMKDEMSDETLPAPFDSLEPLAPLYAGENSSTRMGKLAIPDLDDITESAASMVSRPDPAPEGPSGEMEFGSPDDFNQLELRALFDTDDNLDRASVVERTCQFQGIQACAVIGSSGGARSGQLMARGGDEDFGKQAPSLHEKVTALTSELGIPDAETFSIRTADGMVSFFCHGEADCLAVRHENQFEAGLRQKLILIARGVSGLDQ